MKLRRTNLSGPIHPDVVRNDLRQDKVQFGRGLEAELERDDERIVHLSQDCPLGQRMCDLIAGCDVGFANGLERVDSRCVPLSDLHDLAETALSDNFQ